MWDQIIGLASSLFVYWYIFSGLAFELWKKTIGAQQYF